MGYIYLETNSYINKFNHKNFKKLESISKLVYLNIENYMLRNIANIDKLTNTMTRKHFDSNFKNYIDNNEDNATEFTILVIDLDDFKDINDTYGHLEGDNVLRKVGLELVKNTRATDLVCRYGGDEFIISLLDTSLKEGIQVAENLRGEIEDITISGIETILTVTIGIAHYPTHSKLEK